MNARDSVALTMKAAWMLMIVSNLLFTEKDVNGYGKAAGPEGFIREFFQKIETKSAAFTSFL